MLELTHHVEHRLHMVFLSQSACNYHRCDDLWNEMKWSVVGMLCWSSCWPCRAAAQLVPALRAALSCLLPRVALLPLTLTSLNTSRW